MPSTAASGSVSGKIARITNTLELMENKLLEIDNNSKAIREEIQFLREELLSKKQPRKNQTKPRITVEQKGRFRVITTHPSQS